MRTPPNPSSPKPLHHHETPCKPTNLAPFASLHRRISDDRPSSPTPPWSGRDSDPLSTTISSLLTHEPPPTSHDRHHPPPSPHCPPRPRRSIPASPASCDRRHRFISFLSGKFQQPVATDRPSLVAPPPDPSPPTSPLLPTGRCMSSPPAACAVLLPEPPCCPSMPPLVPTAVPCHPTSSHLCRCAAPPRMPPLAIVPLTTPMALAVEPSTRLPKPLYRIPFDRTIMKVYMDLKA